MPVMMEPLLFALAFYPAYPMLAPAPLPAPLAPPPRPAPRCHHTGQESPRPCGCWWWGPAPTSLEVGGSTPLSGRNHVFCVNTAASAFPRMNSCLIRLAVGVAQCGARDSKHINNNLSLLAVSLRAYPRRIACHSCPQLLGRSGQLFHLPKRFTGLLPRVWVGVRPQPLPRPQPPLPEVPVRRDPSRVCLGQGGT